MINELKKQISELQAQIYKIQDDCAHPMSARQIEHKGSTGNYDPGADCYWTENRCGLCHKFWIEDQ